MNAMKPLVLVSVTLGALALASCAARRPITTPPAGDGPTWSLPAVVPLQDPATDAPISRGPAADGVTTAPLGVGLMFSPNNVLFGGAIDIPLDERLTVGPAVQVGVGDDFMIAPFGQAKYFLPIEDDNGEWVGVAHDANGFESSLATHCVLHARCLRSTVGQRTAGRDEH